MANAHSADLIGPSPSRIVDDHLRPLLDRLHFDLLAFSAEDPFLNVEDFVGNARELLDLAAWVHVYAQSASAAALYRKAIGD